MSYQHQYVDGTRIHFPIGKVVCIGRNYAEHAKELDNPVPTEPLLFIKPGSCVVPLEGGFSIPTERGSVHYEAEIAVLIGKPLSTKPSREEVLDAISGFAPALDLTLRDKQAEPQAKGLPWEIAKSFDNSAVVGKFMPIAPETDKKDINFCLYKNKEIVQQGNTKDLIFTFDFLLSYISKFFTLNIGDLIFTGTPAGVGPVEIGDTLEAFIENDSLLEFMVK